MAIKVIIHISSSAKYNVTNMLKQLTWSGDVDNLPRKIEVQLQNANNLHDGDTLVNYQTGNLVVAYEDGDEFFRGYIFSKSIDESGVDSFVAYDELVYLTKNAHSALIKNKTASETIKSLCQKYGVAVGSIESTGYKIPKKVVQGQALSDLFKELLSETRKHTKRSYIFRSKQGKVYMYSREASPKLTITVKDVISASRDESIEDLRTQVMVTKGSLEPDPKDKAAVKFTSYTKRDSSAASKYGIMQHVENVDDKMKYDAMKKKAASLLDQLNNPDITRNIEFVGDIACTTGNIIEIHDDITNIMGKYYISADSHTWESGVHKMSLQLSKNLK